MNSNTPVLLTGGSGFVGGYFSKYYSSRFNIQKYVRNTPLFIKHFCVLHFAGVAHDLKGKLSIDDYFNGNFELTKFVFDNFLNSNAKVFITISSVNAVRDSSLTEQDETLLPNPITPFGQSKLRAEQYILSKEFPHGKRVYILRACMIHGPGNKGNLNLLYNFVSNNIPWPLGAYMNKRSFCSIDNLMFVIKELIERDDVPSGIYNVADDVPLSTNDLVRLIAKSGDRKAIILKIAPALVEFMVYVGEKFGLPLNSERLKKITSSHLVSNSKIITALGKSLPVSSVEGLLKTFQSFNRQ